MSGLKLGFGIFFLGLGFSRFNVRVRVSAWWLRYELGLNLVVRVQISVTVVVGDMFMVGI